MDLPLTWSNLFLNSSKINHKLTNATDNTKRFSTWGPINTLYLLSGLSPPIRKELGPICCSRYSLARITLLTRRFVSSGLYGEKPSGDGARRGGVIRPLWNYISGSTISTSRTTVRQQVFLVGYFLVLSVVSVLFSKSDRIRQSPKLETTTTCLD